MCQAKSAGGIRCGSHALEAYTKALKSKDAKRIQEAEDDYYCTDKGILELAENNDLKLYYYLEKRLNRIETNKMMYSSRSEKEIIESIFDSSKPNSFEHKQKALDVELEKIKKGERQYAQSENKIVQLFAPGTKFNYKGKEYTSVMSAKPLVANGKGEGKTDIYILATDSSNSYQEIKISYKQKNADSYENWVSPDRAKAILGDKWKNVMHESISENKNNFISSFNDSMGANWIHKSDSYVLGYAVDIRSQPRKLSSKLDLSHSQKKEIYSGSGLPKEKRNCSVEGRIIPNSGVANHILIADKVGSAQEAIDSMQSMDEYVKTHKVELYLAYKTVNVHKSKGWDASKRPLAVMMNYYRKDDGKIGVKMLRQDPLGYNSKDSLNNLLSSKGLP